MSTVQASPTLSKTFHTVRIPSRELASYPKLSALTDLINIAFTASAQQYPGLYDAERKRFEEPSDFLDELGPKGITFITFATTGGLSSDEPELVATTSYIPFASLMKFSKLRQSLESEMKATKLREQLEVERPEMNGRVDYTDPTTENDAVPGIDAKLEQELELGQHTQSEMSVDDDSDKDILKIAVSFVAVAPAWQKHGLASKLLRRVVEEIKSQAKVQGRKDFTLVLNTMKEINDSYWTSKGFKAMGEESFPPGPLGSKTGFTISRMSRKHAVD